ncbi:30S ribosomal protein S6 modification protein RimK [Carbonactinospora thermoautotrophica]|uniref:30S ribosomal protein S6 modification protein RimK n=1 Tax=Carbonactinospora thermoautotrophica TaxID=1469144 RepID=A0A132N178_9ACTN|nr:30S ribosomal protein S6 modification protein RimK [Carbonactinospora thermoautotrophica]KWX09946.1 30S ribosomal protein S6 modification protein RimK [Carbonactinospora thermoautotrophica]
MLVITSLEDPTADLVIAELYSRSVPVTRFDSGDFPAMLAVAARVGGGRGWHGWLETPSRVVDLTAVRAVYYRRPSGFCFPHLDPQDARFAVAQARYGLGGVLASLPGCLYVNHPHRIADAEFKPAQLAVAVEVGFTVPATLITSDPDAAREFVKEHGPVVYKPLAVPAYEIDGIPCTIHVAEVATDELDEGVAGTAHLFQARVDKTADVRVTVVGERVFCVRIDSADGLLDWRTDYDQLTYTVVDPPDGIRRALRAFVGRFGLVYGAFDFALTGDGEWVFLECNPSGQYAWLEPYTGLPLTAAIADLLTRGMR